MDHASTSVQKPRKRKTGKRKRKCEGGEDRTNDLPDSILHHILSFLPTQHAVRTCVLSKRWKCLWTAVSKLRFCEELIRADEMYNTIDFVNFVENVFLRHDAATIIFKLRLTSAVPLDASSVNAWISNVLGRNIEKLTLNITVEPSHPFVFPSSLFTCESLMAMKLNAKHSVFKLPASVYFPNLKLFHLRFMEVCCEEGVQRVSINCPVLEEVMLVQCRWVNVRVDIIAPKLERMIIDDPSDDIYSDCEVKFYAESLVTLDVKSSLAYELSLCNISSLDDAWINVYSKTDVSHRATKLLQGISSVKELMLSYCTINALSDLEDLLMLSNLKSLCFTMTYFLNGDLLTRLFCCLPNIKSLTFANGLNQYSYEGYDWSIEEIPLPFLSRLKYFEIKSFYGNETEISLVGFLLKNACDLRTVTLVSCSKLSEDPMRQLEITKRLLILPRESMKAVIDFT